MKRLNFVLWAFLVSTYGCAAQVDEPEPCKQQKEKFKPKKEGLYPTLLAHKEWIESAKGSVVWQGDRANLKYRDLRHYFLVREELSQALLAGADLYDSDLSRSRLRDAELQNAILECSYLNEADLTRAHLAGANLNKANLTSSDLTDADLQSAKLRHARLEDTKLTNADLQDADLTGAFFEPVSLPDIRRIASAQGFATLRFDRPDALYRLREEFNKNGFRRQERELTYALNRAWEIDGIGTLAPYILFEWTYKWGTEPGRVVWLLAGTIILFGIFYSLTLLRETSSSGIYKDWHAEDKQEYLTRRNCNPLRSGFVYSLTSAFYAIELLQEIFFKIGWSNNFIKKLNPKDYSLRADGLTKTLSAFEAILCTLVIALCFWTYYGRPGL